MNDENEEEHIPKKHHAEHHLHKRHEQSIQKEHPVKSNTGLKVVSVLLIIIAVAALAYYIFGSAKNTTPSTDYTGTTAYAAGTISKEVQDLNKKLSDDDPVLGNPKAPVTIIEFSDFQCPFCGKFYSETLSQIETQYIKTGKAKLVFRDFPLSFHPFAEKAAEAAECANEQGKFWQMHNKLFENQQNLDVPSLKKYAVDLKLDANKFNACLDSGKFASEIQKDEADGQAQGITGTPGFIINGKLISGAQPFDVFKKTIEKALLGGNVSAPKVDLIIVNDKTCADCDASRVTGALQQLFTGISVSTVDVNTPEGKNLVTQYALDKLPSYLLSANVVDADGYTENPNLQQVFTQIADKYKIIDDASGATHFIDPAKQAEYDQKLLDQKKMQQTQLGIVLKDNKPQIDFFIMSYCPYGNQAEEGIAGAYQILKDKAIFVPHYIYYENYGGGGSQYCFDKDNKYCSMHGVQEARQDIRELCVYNNLGTDSFFKFALAMNQQCTAQNADSCWENVAKGLGFDTAAIQSCADKNSASYGDQQLNMTALMDVQGSPTVFIDGESYGGGRAPSDYMAAMCAKFENAPAECKNITVSATTASSTPAAGCGV